ncbi:hypothetical protein GCM10007907_02050 [Chitinimonas prasina]|uniref:N-acetyltransferase domain-containing protein n=1 Tax=Chitinimonas prasina TaxID=1434937 RepID=A0ABQ5Y8Z8_9NEIS|nr:GNAT family N-acetyltransferase [Chitinimonas prasina]GLR11415.1 hypothetical protein GCM10007907_02050 [Chitinimonas prasina]
MKAGTDAKVAKPGWSLRPVVLADQAGLIRLSAQLGYPIENQLLGHNLQFMLARPDHRVLVVADAQGQILGWVHGYVRVVLEAEPAVEVGGLVVDVACRGQGLGRALMAGLEDWARTQAVGRITLRSGMERPEAHCFYLSLGYTAIKQQQAFSKSL